MVPGDRLGPYEILAPIGVGGMGEVYRARDTKLGREVAIKILPDALAHDPERLARFEREAKVLASLNHPNIAAIYGVEDRALIMELVEGETLKGPLALGTALNYAKQIADALEAAHEKGIVHRDLKPANIMITPAGMVKVLDFGLAAVAQISEPDSTDASASPTFTMSPTRAGMILGTAAYMSPEQARGKAVDKRADIWAFGVVLYEMLTGEQAFKGETVSDILAAVIKEDPALDPVPAHLRPTIGKCLRKDPRTRWRDIGDVRMALDESPTATIARPGRTQAIPWIIAAALAVALGLALVFLPARQVERPRMLLPVDLGPSAVLRGTFSTIAISPDGTRLVFGQKGAGGAIGLAIRRLDQMQATELQGTEGARDPFFSPDGQWIGFAAAGKLKKVSAQGGTPSILCDAPNFRGASWGEDGFILAALDTRAGLMRIPESGGSPQPFTELDKEGHEATHRWPQVLPGGQAVLFTTNLLPFFETATITAQSLKSRRRTVVWQGGTFGRYVPSGHLLFVHNGTLFAARMDPDRLRLTSQPAPVLEGIASNSVTGGAWFDFARNGSLIFLPGESTQSHSIYWRTSGDAPALVAALPGAYSLRLAPDSRRIALSVSDGSNSDVWVYDTERDTRTRLTFSGRNSNPVWTPDGKYLLYASLDTRPNQLQAVRADGAGAKVTLHSLPGAMQPGAFSPDGKRFVFSVQSVGTGSDLWILPIAQNPDGSLNAGQPEPLLQSPFNEQDPDISPDGRWLAYVSDETGRQEVYVGSFPATGGRWQISNGGGGFPVWSRKGRELFYLSSNRMMVAYYRSEGAAFLPEKPRIWSEREFLSPSFYRMFDIAPDGKRFVQIAPFNPTQENMSTTRLTILLNFFDEERRRVPVGR